MATWCNLPSLTLQDYEAPRQSVYGNQCGHSEHKGSCFRCRLQRQAPFHEPKVAMEIHFKTWLDVVVVVSTSLVWRVQNQPGCSHDPFHTITSSTGHRKVSSSKGHCCIVNLSGQSSHSTTLQYIVKDSHVFSYLPRNMMCLFQLCY